MTVDEFETLSKSDQLLVVETDMVNLFRSINRDLKHVIQGSHLFVVTPIGIESNGETLSRRMRTALSSVPNPSSRSIEDVKEAIAKVEPCAICVSGLDALVEAVQSTFLAGATGHELWLGDNNVWWVMSARV